MALSYESAIGSHVGMVRSNNQDSGYAGNQLFLVADGMGGHAGGDVASALATRAVSALDVVPNISIAAPDSLSGEPVPQIPVPAKNPAAEAARLADSVLQANKMLRATVRDRPELSGMGTTFTGFLTVGSQLALAHIGDSRLYLIRDGRMKQITKDHTFVQRLVDSGRITEEEAKTHPRRSVLMRVLGDVDSSPDIDSSVVSTQAGDIWLLCSDGLCGYVEDVDIERIVLRSTSLQQAVDGLIDKALSHGAPDNVTVVLVAAVDDTNHQAPQGEQRFVGSATEQFASTAAQSTARTRIINRRRSARRVHPVAESHFEPRVDEYLNELIAETKRRARRRRLFWVLSLCVAAVVLAAGTLFAYQWTQTLYYVGTDGDTVVIYRGVQQNIGSLSLSSVAEDTEIPLSSLGGLERRQIERTLSAGSLEEAREIVTRLGVAEQ